MANTKRSCSTSPSTEAKEKLDWWPVWNFDETVAVTTEWYRDVDQTGARARDQRTDRQILHQRRSKRHRMEHARCPLTDWESTARILVLGQHGFIGAHITRAAVESGSNVLGFSLPADIERGERILDSLGISPPPAIAGDATNQQELFDLLDRYRPDIVVNAVGRIGRDTTTDSWLSPYSVNYDTAVATIDAVAAMAPADRPFIVWIGSQAEYGAAPSPWHESAACRPTTAYGVSKLLATETVMAAIRANVVRGSVFRLPIVFGEAQRPTLLIAQLVVSSLRGDTLPMTAGEQTRMFGYAPDTARWILRAASGQLAGTLPPVINVPGYEPAQVQHLVGLLDNILLNGATADLGALEYRPEEQVTAWPDTSLAESLGPALSTPIDHALRKTVEWYHDNPWFWRKQQ